jgi:hypothetical protein
MNWEEVIIGGVALIWGVILLFTRREILEFSREEGKGLRNRTVINALAITAIVFLFVGGVAIILIRGF